MKKDIITGAVIGFILTMSVLVITAINYTPRVESVTEEIKLPEVVIKSNQPKSKLKVRSKDAPAILDRDLKCSVDKECKLLAEVIYYEARGEPILGQIAVGWVVMNRLKSKKFPDTMDKIVSNKCHFSYRCDGSMKNGFRNEDAYEKAKFVADNILRGNFADPTNGADHYLNPDKVKRLPAWTKEYPKVAIIANHHFHVWR